MDPRRQCLEIVTKLLRHMTSSNDTILDVLHAFQVLLWWLQFARSTGVGTERGIRHPRQVEEDQKSPAWIGLNCWLASRITQKTIQPNRLTNMLSLANRLINVWPLSNILLLRNVWKLTMDDYLNNKMTINLWLYRIFRLYHTHNNFLCRHYLDFTDCLSILSSLNYRAFVLRITWLSW